MSDVHDQVTAMPRRRGSPLTLKEPQDEIIVAPDASLVVLHVADASHRHQRMFDRAGIPESPS